MKTTFRTLLTIFLVYATCAQVFSQIGPEKGSFTVQGIVKAKDSGETLPFAQIEVLGTGHGTTCNVDGYFTLIDLAGEEIPIRISYMGFKTQTLKLHRKDAEAMVTVLLETDVAQLDEVVLTTVKPKEVLKVASETSKVSINPKELATLPNLGEVDIFRALQLLPGISGTSETSSGLVVRGGTPDQNLILFDGFTVYHVDHFYGIYSAFNASILKDVQLYKGAFPAKFGGRASSVLDITSISGNTQKISGDIRVNLLSLNGTLEVPLSKKLSMVTAVRRSYTDVLKSGLYKKLFDNLNSGNDGPDVQANTGSGTSGLGQGGGNIAGTAIDPDFYFYDLNNKISYRANENNMLSLSFYNGKDNLDKSTSSEEHIDIPENQGGGTIDINSKTTDLTEWGNLGASFRWGRQWSKKLYSNLNIGASEYFSDYLNEGKTTTSSNSGTNTISNATVQKNNVQDLTVRLDNEWKFNQNNTATFGLAHTRNDIDYEVLYDEETIENRDQKGHHTAIYLENSTRLGNKLSFNLGARATHFNITDKTYFSPRAGLTYRLKDNFKLKTSWGVHHQFINRIIMDDILASTRDFWLLADDKDIKTIKAKHYVAGFTWKKNGFLVDVEGYYKDMDGLMEYSRRTTGLDQNREEDIYFYNGSGTAKGIEVLLQKKTGRHTGWIGYTLGQVDHTFKNLNKGKTFPAANDQRHEVKLVNMVKLGKWNLSATWIYATGKPYTSPIGKYELTTLDGNKRSYINVGDKNANRLPNYHRLDLSTTYNFDLGRFPVQVGASIFNLYGRQNIKSRIFTYEYFDRKNLKFYNPPRLKMVDVKMLGFTPNLFLNVKF